LKGVTPIRTNSDEESCDDLSIWDDYPLAEFGELMDRITKQAQNVKLAEGIGGDIVAYGCRAPWGGGFCGSAAGVSSPGAVKL